MPRRCYRAPGPLPRSPSSPRSPHHATPDTCTGRVYSFHNKGPAARNRVFAPLFLPKSRQSGSKSAAGARGAPRSPAGGAAARGVPGVPASQRLFTGITEISPLLFSVAQFDKYFPIYAIKKYRDLPFLEVKCALSDCEQEVSLKTWCCWSSHHRWQVEPNLPPPQTTPRQEKPRIQPTFLMANKVFQVKMKVGFSISEL